MAMGSFAARLVNSLIHIASVSEPTSSLSPALACLSCFELTYHFACMMSVQMRRHFPEAGNTWRKNNET